MERPGNSFKHEVATVGYAALFLLLGSALLSYNPQDNSLFHYGSAQHVVHNWIGFIGANVASFLFMLFGITAYIFWALLLLPLYRYYRGPVLISRQGGALQSLRVVALVSAGLVLGIMAQLSGFLFHGSAAGGFFGIWATRWLRIACGTTGILVGGGALLWLLLCFGLEISLMQQFLGFGHMMAALAIMAWRAVFRTIWYVAARGAARMIQDAPQEPVPGKTDADEFDFWAAVASPHVVPAETSAQVCVQNVAVHGEHLDPAALDKCIETQFASHAVYRAARHIKLLNTPFSYAPNSVLMFNIFAVRSENAPALYTMIIKIGVTKEEKIKKPFVLPEVPAVNEAAPTQAQQVLDDAAQRSSMLESKLVHFGVKGKVTAVKPGPVITLFEYKPDIDSKISKITALEDDLAMALTAHSIRIIAPIPGKDAVGFEIANATRTDVLMDRIMQSKEWATTKARLPIILGVDVVGNPMIQDLASTPHLLVGGATGSGKSVGLNVMLMSLLYKLSPDNLKLILIDPKRLEFTPYADIPHLLFPIVTQPAKAISVLKWVVHEMEQRYELMARAGVRNMAEYQAWYKAAARGEPFKSLPFLVVIIDELADLMMVGGKDVETHIVRIVQMARAAGIHMIIATQRPSVDVVTGLIKINFPSRVAFRVSSKVDSRTILDTQGAEKLLGRGDMLFMHSASPELRRVHGAYVTDEQIEELAQFWRDQTEPVYIDMQEVVVLEQKAESLEYEDELYGQVVDFVKQSDEISISMLQRQYRIGFNRSARLIEKLESQGLIAPAQGSKPRKVLR